MLSIERVVIGLRVIAADLSVRYETNIVYLSKMLSEEREVTSGSVILRQSATLVAGIKLCIYLKKVFACRHKNDVQLL